MVYVHRVKKYGRSIYTMPRVVVIKQQQRLDYIKTSARCVKDASYRSFLVARFREIKERETGKRMGRIIAASIWKMDD